MMKSISLILTLVAGLMIFMAAAEAGDNDTGQSAETVAFNESGPITLRQVVNVTGEVIYLGDLFMNVDVSLADKVVAYAPEPGRQATYGANWLYRVARYFKLDWKPQTLRTQSVITRDSNVIDREQIEEAIMMHLIDRGVDPDMDAELANRNIRLYLPVTEIPDIAIEELKYDEHTRRFTAMITAPANSPLAQHFRMTGRIYQMTEIPVLVRTVSTNEIIRDADVELADLLGFEDHLDRILPETIDSPGQIANFGNTHSTSGEGDIDRSEEVNLQLAAVITQILPNGNLVLLGRQEVKVNQELRELMVTGIIRTSDIDTDNSVDHTKIAEMRVAYGGRGTLSDLQQPRWGMQMWDILFPF